jgi:hypothetical protein
MTLRQYLAVMSVAALLGWGGVATVVLTVNPAEAAAVLLVFLYLSLFTALTCTITVAGFLARAVLLKANFDLQRHVAVSFRQGVLLALSAVMALFLSSHGWLYWWSGLLIIVVMTALETLMISAKIKVDES